MQLLIDLVRAVKGLGRLFRFDASYAGYFDKSIQGTWRSFFAMMLVAPLVALGLPEDLSEDFPKATEFRVSRGPVLDLRHRLVRRAGRCTGDRPLAETQRGDAGLHHRL